MMREENRTVDTKEIKKDLKGLANKNMPCVGGMQLHYSCHNNDKLTDQNQSNTFCYLGISVGSLALKIYKAWHSRNSEPFWHNFNHLHHLLG